MADIKYPAETLVLADSDWTHSTSDCVGSNSYHFNYVSFWAADAFIPSRHNEGANMVFADGHAKWHKMSTNPASTYVGSVKFTAVPVDLCFRANGNPKY